MKILHTVEQYYPSLGGMQEVVKQLSERLVHLGHEVTVATSHNAHRDFDTLNGVKIFSFNIEGNEVRGVKGEIDAYRNFLLNSKFDILTNFAAQQWATDLALPILSDLKSKNVLVPTGFSGFYFPEYKNYFEKMKKWMREYDMNVFLSDDYRDINFARVNGINKTMIIPNGAAEDEFLKTPKINIKQKLGIKKDIFLILHVGSYSGMKGHKEAVEIFLKAKIRNAVLLFIGNNNEIFKTKFSLLDLLRTRLSKKEIIIKHNLTREETIAAYQIADLFLFPSNIECSPIVLFEAMASHTPFLTTDVGNAKEIIELSSGGILLPTIIDENGYSHANIRLSAKILEELFANAKTRKELSDAGFNSWKKKFTWELIARKYEQLYMNLLA